MENETLGQEIGVIVDYYSKVNAAGIELKSGDIKIGDKIRVKGHTTDFEQVVESIQLDNRPVEEANRGDSIGIKIKDKARKGDKVYKI
ncbi:MAG: hypothetical protein A2Z72_05175 [Omnitrophica bacterium RBG_13_46_9]|nr:MAG: hypothetical protein A2Z72_05175 [Omnitrophica bacterium RBG_13_46_9]